MRGVAEDSSSSIEHSKPVGGRIQGICMQAEVECGKEGPGKMSCLGIDLGSIQPNPMHP